MKEGILKRGDEEKALEYSIYNRYFPANSENEMLDFLRIHHNEESNASFIQMVFDLLCSYDVQAVAESYSTETASIIPKITTDAPGKIQFSFCRLNEGMNCCWLFFF